MTLFQYHFQALTDNKLLADAYTPVIFWTTFEKKAKYKKGNYLQL